MLRPEAMKVEVMVNLRKKPLICFAAIKISLNCVNVLFHNDLILILTALVTTENDTSVSRAIEPKILSRQSAEGRTSTAHHLLKLNNFSIGFFF